MLTSGRLTPRYAPMLLALLLLGTLSTHPLLAAASGKARADALYHRAYALQQTFHTLEALEVYKQALRIDPDHGLAHYEIGWSYWILEDWPQVIAHWERALALKAGPPELTEYLAMARERALHPLAPLVHVPMHTRAEGRLPGGGRVTLELVARFQQYKPDDGGANDHLDHRVFSPKSVHFSRDGAKAYVQALEGYATLVYDTVHLRRIKVIPYRFDAHTANLFDPKESADFAPKFARAIQEGWAPVDFNTYKGKPVEAELTHQGRYLWVSQYRRDYDLNGALPSSVAVIDTQRDEIVRVMQTGPIPKFLAASPDGHWLAVVQWGENTVNLIDISAPDPRDFHHAGEIVVERRMEMDPDRKVNRDRYCGLCLRGAVFTPDSRYLLVARMGGGGIAVLDVPRRRYVGSVFGMKPTPRQLVLSKDGAVLFVGSNSSGYVATYDVAALMRTALAGGGRLKPLKEVRSGPGTRTIALSPDGRTLYAAVNQASKVVVLDAASLNKITEIAADSFPVGLAVSPDGGQLWVTAQGRKLRGGNSIMVYGVRQSD